MSPECLDEETISSLEDFDIIKNNKSMEYIKIININGAFLCQKR